MSYLNRLLEHKFVIPNEPVSVLDLGSGMGTKSLPLLPFCSMITLVDTNKEGLLTLLQSNMDHKDRIRTINCDIRMFVFDRKYDIIFIRNVLPFFSNTHEIKDIIDKSLRHLKENGLFIVTLFGNNHQWRNRPCLTFSRTEADDLISNKPIFWRGEQEGFVIDMSGQKVYWHSFEFWVHNSSS